MLDLYKLHVFSHVARAGSFSAAAEGLYMSQPAVSQHMQELEAMLGVTLFTRGRRGVALTTEGKRLAEYAERILALVAEAEAALTSVSKLASGHVAIGATPGVGAYLLPAWIHDFREQYPALTVSMTTDTTGEIVGQLIARQLDLGFVEGELDRAAESVLASQVLCDVPQLVVVGPRHPWFGQPSAHMRDFDGQPFIMRQPGSQTRRWLDDILIAHQVRPKVVAEFDNPEAIKRSVASGNAVGVLPMYAVKSEIARQALHTVAVDAPLSRALRAVWARAFPLSPLARAFMAFTDDCLHSES